MELYAEYMQEREGATVISTPDGFLSYRIEGKECLVCSIFIRKESRDRLVWQNLASRLFQIAKERNCDFLSANVFLGTKNASTNIKLLLQLDFTAVSASNNCLTFTRNFKNG